MGRRPTAQSPEGEASGDAGSLSDLVNRARKGDRTAFEELVKATYAASYTLAYRLVGDEEDARDVVQEAYLRAYRGLKRFRGDAQFTTWLYRITANCAATQLGRRSRNRHEELLEDAPLVDKGRRGDPEDHADQGELREQLQEALVDLPPRLRAVVVLRDIYDLPHEAIAAELGISESAAKVRLHRARRKLPRAALPAGRRPTRRGGRRGGGGPCAVRTSQIGSLWWPRAAFASTEALGAT